QSDLLPIMMPTRGEDLFAGTVIPFRIKIQGSGGGYAYVGAFLRAAVSGHFLNVTAFTLWACDYALAGQAICILCRLCINSSRYAGIVRRLVSRGILPDTSDDGQGAGNRRLGGETSLFRIFAGKLFSAQQPKLFGQRTLCHFSITSPAEG